MGTWFNAGAGELPKHKERVLVSASGVYYICVFDNDARHFRAENEQMLTIFKVDDPEIYWSRTDPNQTGFRYDTSNN